jgi:uncharacterized protein with PQ loop repeat
MWFSRDGLQRARRGALGAGGLGIVVVLALGCAGPVGTSRTLASDVDLAAKVDSAEARTLLVLVLSAIMLSGCEDLVVRDTASLLAPRFHRSEVIGLLAGAGTTFAALPDLIAMLKRRSSKGMNPRMAGIMGVFQIGWIYYGLLITSRPVIAWNMLAVLINFLSVAAYLRFAGSERNPAQRPTS